MDRAALIKNLKDYSSDFREEMEFVDQFLSLLKEDNCYTRERQSGHMTGSGWIVSHDFSQVLLLHHQKLDKWLQPGGHADGNEDIRQVAQNEVEEETSLSSYLISPHIFDIDIHTIPLRKGTPEHLHYDIRFLFKATKEATIVKNSESRDLQWLSLEEALKYAENNASIRRMILKTKNLQIL